MKRILFNSRTPEWAFLSNFYRASFELGGEKYPTVKHYYQSRKTLNPHYAEKNHQCSNTALVRKLGRKCPLRPDWEKIKVQVMEEAVRAKFTQNPHLKEKLLATGDAELVELSPWDRFWGVDRNGRGQNQLGKILMKIREELRERRGK